MFYLFFTFSSNLNETVSKSDCCRCRCWHDVRIRGETMKFEFCTFLVLLFCLVWQLRELLLIWIGHRFRWPLCCLLLQFPVREAALYGLGELYATYSHRSGITWIANQCLHAYFSHVVEDQFVSTAVCQRCCW